MNVFELDFRSNDVKATTKRTSSKRRIRNKLYHFDFSLVEFGSVLGSRSNRVIHFINWRVHILRDNIMFMNLASRITKTTFVFRVSLFDAE